MALPTAAQYAAAVAGLKAAAGATSDAGLPLRDLTAMAAASGVWTLQASTAGNPLTALTAAVNKATIRAPFAVTVTAVKASVLTAPTGSTILVDINVAGATILSTKLMIDASEFTSATAATPYVLGTTAIADDAEITVDLDQVGSSVAGAGLVVYIYWTRA